MAKSSQVAESMLEQGAEMLRHLPTDAMDTAKEFAAKTRDEATHLMESTGEQASDLATAIVKTISKNPVRAVCVALSVGCVLGIMFVRR